MSFTRGQRVFVDWPATKGPQKVRARRTIGRVCTAAELNLPQTDGNELFVNWSRGKGFVHLALLEADVRLNGTTITPVVRTYTRPYVGHLKAEYMTPEGASKVNGILLDRGMGSLCMKGQGKVPNEVVVPAFNRHVFRSVETPREEDWPFFSLVTGPFRTARGAYYMAQYGENNPHCQTVAQAERLAERLEDKRAEKCL